MARSGYMAPLVAAQYSVQLGLCYPKLLSEQVPSFARSGPTFNFSNFFFVEFASPVICSVFSTAPEESPARDRIAHIFQGRSCAQMCWVTARRIVARVKDIMGIWNGTNRERVRQSTSRPILSFQQEGTIGGRLLVSTNNPWPAILSTARLIHSGPELVYSFLSLEGFNLYIKVVHWIFSRKKVDRHTVVNHSSLCAITVPYGAFDGK